jgi:hypothetical protein
MPDRQDAIPEAYRETLQWMFNDSKVSDSNSHPAEDYNSGIIDAADFVPGLPQQPRQNFSEWLQSKESLYWITGKPGAGKSTLIKFLQQNDRTKELVQKHTPCDDPSIKTIVSVAAFFFWVSGSRIQRSKEGLLRALLHQLLRECPDLVGLAFPVRMQRSRLLSADPLDFSYKELLESLECLLSVKNRSFLLFVDGLDEFSGDCADIMRLVHRIAARPSVKICVASRFWPIFEDAFGGTSMLRVESLTRRDILTYIHGKFGSSRQFPELLTVQRQEAEALISNLADKASGVFLWVCLAVESLLEGIRDGDDVRELQKRLYDLPGELEDFSDRILHSIDPNHAVQASKLFQFHRAFPEETNLISLHLSQVPLGEAMTMETKPYTDEEAHYFAKKMRSKLYSRCKCFLEVEEPCGPTSSVTYLHRTAKDFLEQPMVWCSVIAKAPTYNTGRAASISRFMHTKIMSFKHPWRDVAELCKLLLFDAALEQIPDPGHRRIFADAVEGMGDAYYNGEFSSWVDNLFLDKTLLSDTVAEMVEIRDMFDLMLAADFDWYVVAKLRTEPNILTRRIHDRHTLVFAVEKDLWRSQKALLENGADPNLDDGQGSPWRLLLARSLEEMRSVLPDATRGEMLRALTIYLDCGADPNAIVRCSAGTNEEVKASGVIHLALASMSDEKYNQDRRHLEASFKTAADGAKNGKRKRYLGLR